MKNNKSNLIIFIIAIGFILFTFGGMMPFMLKGFFGGISFSFIVFFIIIISIIVRAITAANKNNQNSNDFTNSSFNQFVNPGSIKSKDKVCPYCGTKYEHTKKYCDNCGASLGD